MTIAVTVPTQITVQSNGTVVQSNIDILNFDVSMTVIDNGSGKVTIGSDPFIAFRHVFMANQLDSPNNANWTINALAPASADTVNNALVVRRFDDTTEEGAGFMVYLPSGTTNLIFSFISRAQTAPGGTVGVVPRLYRREIPDNGAVTAWSSALALTTISIPTNTNFQYDTQTISLATLGLTAGRHAQFELTRQGTNGSDTLTGDWCLLSVRVEFS